MDEMMRVLYFPILCPYLYFFLITKLMLASFYKTLRMNVIFKFKKGRDE